MGIYANCIFPYLEMLATSRLGEERRSLLAATEGKILEIGSGAGQNFPHFSPNATHITGLEPSSTLRNRSIKKLQKKSLQNITVVKGVAEELPWKDNEFDMVVSFLVLCSVKNPQKALTEIYRVLKNGGKLLLFEHVVSPNPKTAKWQNRLTPYWKVVGCGCQLNRDTKTTIQKAGFDVDGLQGFRSKNMGPALTASVIGGIAFKP